SQDVELENARGNVVLLKCTAPAKGGEYEVEVRVRDPRRPDDWPGGQVSVARNKLETFLTVTKEGLSVLLVDRQRDGGPQAIYDATLDKRIRVTPVWLRGDKP